MMKLQSCHPGSSSRPWLTVKELKGVHAKGGEIVIGAMTTQHEMIGSDLLRDEDFDFAQRLHS